MRSIGFHASSGVIRYVVLEGTRSAPVYIEHARRPLQLIEDRPTFVQNAKNLFQAVFQAHSPDIASYVLSMNATSQKQIASLILPFGMLNATALESKKPCREYIGANFSKTFFKNDAVTFTNRYAACDVLIGVHPPNWTDSERQAALAAIAGLGAA